MDKISEIKPIKEYAEWLAAASKAMGSKAFYEIKARGFDSKRQIAIFYAVFGGVSDYVYALQFDVKSGKVNGMRKIWNDGYMTLH